MVRVSNENMFSAYTLSKKETVIKHLLKLFDRAAKYGKPVHIYLNGGSYYMQYLDENNIGFGSGSLLIVFERSDSLDIALQKITELFEGPAKEFNDKVYYGGWGYDKDPDGLADWENSLGFSSVPTSSLAAYLEQRGIGNGR